MSPAPSPIASPRFVMSCHHIIVLSLALLWAGPTRAIDFQFHLTGNTASASVSDGVNQGALIEKGAIDLIDATNRSPTTTGFFASVGDTLRVQVDLSAPWTIPGHAGAPAAGNYPNHVSIGIGSGNGTVIYIEGSLRFSLDGALVDPTPFTPWGGSGGELVAGGYSALPGPGLTFDSISFSAKVNQVYDNSVGDWTNGMAIDGIRPTLSYQVYSPVPEPAKWLLFIGVLAGVGLMGPLRRGSGVMLV